MTQQLIEMITKEKLMLAFREVFDAGREQGECSALQMYGTPLDDVAFVDFFADWNTDDAKNALSILSTVTEELDAAKAAMCGDEQKEEDRRRENYRFEQSFFNQG